MRTGGSTGSQDRTRDPEPSLDKQLRFAITNRRLIRVTYGNAARLGEPHDYGIQLGAPKLLFYQLQRTGANRAENKAIGWRLLEFAKIETCVVTEKKFPGSRGLAHHQHLTWDKLFARVANPDSRKLAAKQR